MSKLEKVLSINFSSEASPKMGIISVSALVLIKLFFNVLLTEYRLGSLLSKRRIFEGLDLSIWLQSSLPIEPPAPVIKIVLFPSKESLD